MKRNKVKLVLFGVAAVSAYVVTYGFDFVKDGCASPIALPEKTFVSSELAAKELADYTEKATGVRPKIMKGEMPSGAVVIGSLETLTDVPKTVREKHADDRRG